MARKSDPPAPEPEVLERLPREGGSYLIDRDGRITRQAQTIGPDDPQHPAQRKVT